MRVRAGDSSRHDNGTLAGSVPPARAALSRWKPAVLYCRGDVRGEKAPMRWLNLLFVLLINAVPLVGVKMFGWSVGVVLMLYWVENLLTAVFTTARIALHRALTRKRGHWRTGTLGTKVNNKPSRSGLLGEYAVMAFVFTLAHGIFVIAIVFL